MAYGEGVLTHAELVVTGLTIMLLGCVLLALTGDTMLRFLGVP
jgi:hypothetical protein